MKEKERERKKTLINIIRQQIDFVRVDTTSSRTCVTYGPTKKTGSEGAWPKVSDY